MGSHNPFLYMAEKDIEEMLALLKKIDKRLLDMQIRIAKDKILAPIESDSRIFSNVFSSLSILIIEIYLVIIGYTYITTTTATTEIPPIAIIGIIGITIAILNSILNAIKDVYLSIKAWGRLENEVCLWYI